MICPDCKAAAAKVCADHHRTSNHEDDADREIDRLRARVAELEAALASRFTADQVAGAIAALRPEMDEAVAREREACAREADKYRHWPCTAIAAAIRARGGGA